MIRIILAECHPPLLLVAISVGVGCGGDWVSASLVERILLADQPLVLVEGVLVGVVAAAGNTNNPPTLTITDHSFVLVEGASAGVVAAAGDAKMLPTLLTLPQGEVWITALVIFSIPIPPWCALRPPQPWVSIFHWGQANSLDTDIVILTLTNINTVIVIHVTIHPTTGVFNLGQLSVSHQILGGPDQVISVTVLHDSMTREQVQVVPGAWIQEQSPTQEAVNVRLIGGKTIHSSCSSMLSF